MTSQTSTPNSVTPLPGGVNSALQYRFNRATGSFLTNPVFDLTYNKAQKVQYNGKTYSIPDGVSYSPVTSSVETSETCLLQSEQDFSSYYSKSLQLSGSVPTEFGIVSASAGTSSMVSNSNFNFASNSYAINTAAQACCQISRAVGSVNPDKTFTSALQQLPTAITSQNDQAQYEKFFGLYGTHYLVSGSMGASYIMVTTVNQSLVQSSGTQTVSNNIGLGFQSLEGGASLSASTVTGSSQFFSTNSDKVSCQIYTFGGNGGSTTVETFLDSAFAYPA